MSLQHFAFFNPQDGLWHAAYDIPESMCMSSIGSALTERAAAAMAADANREQARKFAKAMADAIAPADRPIPRGFYTNAEAD